MPLLLRATKTLTMAFSCADGCRRAVGAAPAERTPTSQLRRLSTDRTLLAKQTRRGPALADSRQDHPFILFPYSKCRAVFRILYVFPCALRCSMCLVLASVRSLPSPRLRPLSTCFSPVPLRRLSSLLLNPPWPTLPRLLASRRCGISRSSCTASTSSSSPTQIAPMRTARGTGTSGLTAPA